MYRKIQEFELPVEQGGADDVGQTERTSDHPYLKILPDIMYDPSQVALDDLSSVETLEGNNLIHLLCKDKLQDAKNIKNNVSPTQRHTIRELLKTYGTSPKADILQQLLKRGCEPHKLNKQGETPFAIQWKRCQGTIPHKPPKLKILQLEPQEKDLLSALSRAGAGPSRHITREIVDLTVVITSHNAAAHRENLPDPEQILQWTPLEVLLGEENNCDVQVEMLQHLVKHLDDDKTEPLVVIRVFGSASRMLHYRVAEYGTLMEFLLALHRLFSRRPAVHSEFLRRRHVQELLPVVAALMGDSQCGAVNEQDEDTGFSPLHIAAAWGLDKVVKDLLEHPQINVNITSRLVPNPLMHVFFHVKKTKMWQTDLMGHYVEIIKMLVENDRLYCAHKDRNGATALSLCIKVVGDMGCRYREKHLYYSLHQHKTQDVLIPLEEEQSISVLCVKEGHDKELASLMQDHPDLDLDWADENEMTVLHVASKMAMYTTIKSLIKKKPGLCNIADKHGNTPLFYLAAHLTSQQTLEMIQQHTGLWDFRHTNNLGERCLEYYRHRSGKIYDKQIYNVLKRHTDTPVPETLKRQRDLHRSQMTINPRGAKKGPDVKRPSIEVESLVQQMFTIEDVFHRLVEIKGDTVNSLDNEKSPLICCAEQGLLEELKYLLEHNGDVDVNLTGRNGCTGLHLAALAGQIECAKVLLRTKGININAQDSQGNTALFYAVVKFPPSVAISLVPTNHWGFAIENFGSQTSYGYYKKHVHEVDIRLEEQLRRRCAPGTVYKPVTSAPSIRKTVRESSWDDAHALIQPITAFTLGSAPPPTYASLENTRPPLIPPPEREIRDVPPLISPPEREIEDEVWSVVHEDRSFLLANFIDSDLFFNHLIQEKVMDSEYVSNKFRRTQKTDAEVADEILEYMTRKGHNAFRVFLRALDVSNQERVSERLRTMTRGLLEEAEDTMPPEGGRSAGEKAQEAGALRAKPAPESSKAPKPQFRKTWAP